MQQDFNPRSPRGGATKQSRRRADEKAISIHAPHEGERLVHKVLFGQPAIFQSTLPTRGSDGRCSLYPPTREGFQSTLPTRGSDKHHAHEKADKEYFNPRSPRGGATTQAALLFPFPSPFQSTLPTRGSDLVALINHEIDGNDFNPRSPRGGATNC